MQNSLMVKMRLPFVDNDLLYIEVLFKAGGHRGRDRMVVGFTTTYTISAYHH